MIRIVKYFAISAMLLLSLYSCSAKNGMIADDLSYEEILKLNTVSGKVYDKFETKLIANVTYKDVKFVEAQVNKKAKELLYDKRRISSLVGEAERENTFYINFFVAVYTPDDRYADFSKTSDLWKFFIKKNDIQIIEAHAVKKVPKSDLPEYETLYPYLSNWMDCYEISFTRSDLYNMTNSRELSRPFSILITGRLGKLEAVFD